MKSHPQRSQRAIPDPKHSSHNHEHDSTFDPRSTKATLPSLPTELHLAISGLLSYPDALSLKHTNRTFYNLVDTGVGLKIDWLVSRRKMRLKCPNDRGCDLRSDSRFCRGSIALLMKQRRKHIECETRPGIGCVICATPTCSYRRNSRVWCRSRIRIHSTFTSWRILLALLPILLAFLWAAMPRSFMAYKH